MVKIAEYALGSLADAYVTVNAMLHQIDGIGFDNIADTLQVICSGQQG